MRIIATYKAAPRAVLWFRTTHRTRLNYGSSTIVIHSMPLSLNFVRYKSRTEQSGFAPYILCK